MKFLRWLFGLPDPAIARAKESARRFEYGYNMAAALLAAGVEPMSMIEAAEKADLTAPGATTTKASSPACLSKNGAHVRHLLEKHHGVSKKRV